jgi:hypothetical protein
LLSIFLALPRGKREIEFSNRILSKGEKVFKSLNDLFANPLKKAVLTSLTIAASSQAGAYPVIDQPVDVRGLPIAVFKDYQNPNVYWYIPQSIEPWKRDDRYRSSLFNKNGTLSFVFRGQASVDEAMLEQVAKAVGTSKDRFMPITYDESSGLVCQNFFMEEDKVSWLFPTQIGNYLEVVPLSLRTKNREVIPELEHHLTSGGGLACTVSVKFKGVSTAYKLKAVADFTKIYERFEAAAHAEGLWWEVDLHTMIEKLRSERLIDIQTLEDATLPQTELDKKIQAATDEILKAITTAMFTPTLKLPQGDIAGRGKPWSLRADYRRSEETSHVRFNLDSSKVQLKSSQISIRLSID